MCNQNGCGGMNCGCSMDEMDAKDKVAILEEKEKILEAKLATIRHMKDAVKTEKAKK